MKYLNVYAYLFKCMHMHVYLCLNVMIAVIQAGDG